MRTRTAKKLAQRVDLNYFKRPQGLRRWRGLLSLAVPAAALLWLATLAAAGNRTVYSSGPVSSAHAFVEAKCEVCHTREASFRSHVTDQGCLTCHDAPGHPPSPPAAATAGQARLATGAVQTAGGPHGAPACATCHREHQGRVQLAATADKFCVDCHGDLTSGAAAPGLPQSAGISQPPGTSGPSSPGPWPLARDVGAFPANHPEFAVLRTGYKDPGTIRFNHEVHNSPTLRGPSGPEKLECSTCHKPEIARVGSGRLPRGLIAPVTYQQQCARCHTLFFDERIDLEAPHVEFRQVIPAVERALSEFIRANPAAVTQSDVPGRRIPLNFPREAEPPARTPQEWVMRRSVRAQRLLSERTCAYCHGPSFHTDGGDYGGPQFRPTNLHTQWMPRARFDHTPHLMVECASCHTGAETSRDTADVLMPSIATCATCHAPSKGASAQCVECHGYHDWTKAQPVKPHFKLTDFQ